MRGPTRGTITALAMALLAVVAITPITTAGGPSGRAGEPRQAIAFTRQTADGAVIVTTDRDGTDERVVPLTDPPEDFAIPVWSPDRTRLLISHMLRFSSDGELLPFRPAIVRPDGSEYRLLPMPGAPFDAGCASWSVDGARLFCSIGGDQPGVVSVRSSDGGDARRLSTNPFGSIDLPIDVSPDGKHVLILREQPGPEPNPEEDETFALYTVRTDGSRLRLLAPYGIVQGDEIGAAHWSPDGRSILASSPDGRLLTVDVDSGKVRYLHLGVDGFPFMPNWSPDGTRIVFALFGPTQEDLYTADRSGAHVRPLTDTPDFEHGADWR